MNPLLPGGRNSARLLSVAAVTAFAPFHLGAEVTTYTDETAYIVALLQLGYTSVDEGFESAAWDGVRSTISGGSMTAASVTSQGITWRHNFPEVPSNKITTGSGAARTGSYGFYALPHGNFLSGGCTVPGVCGDGFKGSTPPGTAMFAVGGWIRTNTPPAQVGVFLDGAPAAIDFGDTPLSPPNSQRFFGIIDTAGFNEFEFRELEGTAEDAKFIFSDDFTIGLAAAGCGANTPPTAAFTLSQTDAEVIFTDASSDTEGTVVQWLWDFGDGNYSSQQNPVHTYASNGNFPVILYVRDDGNCADESPPQLVSVTSYPPADIAITNPANGATIDGTITITVDFVDPPSQVETVTYFLDGEEFDNSEEDPFSIQWDTTGTPDGAHTLEARLVKLDTTEIFSDPVAVTISNTPPPTPLETWRVQHFATMDLADPAKEATVWGNGADPDKDSRTNWYEYVFGGHPLNPMDQGFEVQPVVTDTGGAPIFGFSYPRRTNDPSLTYTPAQSADFQTWHSGPAYLLEIGTAPLGPDFERVAVEDAGSPLSPDIRFGKVGVQ